MINIQTIIKPYVFMDGDKEISTLNPTNNFFEEFTKDKSTEGFDKLFEAILKEEDRHYAKELNPLVKFAIIKDYFDYHSKQIDEVMCFPSAL